MKLRRDVSQIEDWKAGNLKNKDIMNRLEKTYKIEDKSLAVVSEELKQRITAQAAKIQRFDKRTAQYRQNRDFQLNQKRLYAGLQGETQSAAPNQEV